MRAVVYPARSPEMPAGEPATHDVVVFYDRRHTDRTRFSEHGQRVTMYRAASLLSDPPTGGLALRLGTSAYDIDADTLTLVLTWLTFHLTRAEN